MDSQTMVIQNHDSYLDGQHPPRNDQKRKPNCVRCSNHGILVSVKGHKRLCQFRECTCDKCIRFKEIQSILATQARLRRDQQELDLEYRRISYFGYERPVATELKKVITSAEDIFKASDQDGSSPENKKVISERSRYILAKMGLKKEEIDFFIENLFDFNLTKIESDLNEDSNKGQSAAKNSKINFSSFSSIISRLLKMMRKWIKRC